MTDRVSTYIELPVDADPQLRRALTDILRRHAVQINWATGQDSTTVASSTVVAHDLVAVDATAGTVTVMLIPAAKWTDREIRIKLTSTNNVAIVHTTGSETLDGTACATLSTQYSVMRVMSDGSQWWKV